MLPDGKVLVVGGLSATGNTIAPVNSAEIFSADGMRGAWAMANSPATARADHAATILPDGKVLITGGRGGPGVAGAALNSTEIYDPNARTWSAGIAMRTARAGHTATTLSSGAVLVVGGRSGAPNSQSLNSAELLTPGAQAWQATTAPTVGRAGHTVTILRDGRALVVGGNTDRRTETFQDR
jgi:N-acetylneuraminic acid mutarotase